MLKNVCGGTAIVLLLVWLGKVSTTQSKLIAFGFPLIGTVCAFVWFFLAAQERLAARTQNTAMALAELELLKKAVREKKAREAAQTPNSRGPGTPGAGASRPSGNT